MATAHSLHHSFMTDLLEDELRESHDDPEDALRTELKLGECRPTVCCASRSRLRPNVCSFDAGESPKGVRGYFVPRTRVWCGAILCTVPAYRTLYALPVWRAASSELHVTRVDVEGWRLIATDECAETAETARGCHAERIRYPAHVNVIAAACTRSAIAVLGRFPVACSCL
jgi:hypothetical protein